MAVAGMSKEWLGAVQGGLLAMACLVAVGQAETAVPGATGGADAPPRQFSDARVCVTLDVTGELIAAAGRDAAAVREPVEMAARFDFDEIAATPSSPGATAGPVEAGQLVARRMYRDATASMRIGATTTNVALAADARRLLVARRGTTPLPYLANGFLSGEEFDLLDTPFDSVLLEDLLPSASVEVGQSWEIPGDLTAGLLSIDTVESGVIEARVQKVTDASAEIVISGIVDGAVDGVPTHVTVEGSFSVAATSVAAVADTADPQPARHELHGRITQVSVFARRAPVLRPRIPARRGSPDGVR